MPIRSFKISAGAGAVAAAASNLIARFGVCVGGLPAEIVNVNQVQGVYTYNAGQDPTPDLVAGPLHSAALYGTTYGRAGHYAVKVPATTAGTISDVAKPGGDTSPTPSITGSAFDAVTNSPYGSYKLAFQYATGGLPGVAVVNVALDGASYDYTFALPPALPATIRGTVSDVGITWASLENLTLRFKPDGGSVVTVAFPASVAAEADILGAFSSAPTLAAVFVQVGDARFLQVSGIALGTAAGSLDFLGGSAEDLLGFTPSCAVQRGTISTASSFTFAGLDNETLIFTPDGGSVVTATMGATVASEANVLAAFSAISTLVAYFVHTAAGAHYLEVAALTPGSGGALLSGAGTADTTLGFTGAVTTHGNAAGVSTGVDSKVFLPLTGLTVTWPSTGPYTQGVVHTAATTGPRHSQADMDTALAAFNASGLPAGIVEIIQEPPDGTSLAGLVGDLDATMATWEGQVKRKFVQYLVHGPVALSDSAIKSALAAQQSRYGYVAAGDWYYDAVSPSPSGSFDHSVGRGLGVMLAAFSLSEDPGNSTFGAVPGAHVTGPDGITQARDEDTASVKLGQSTGPGFTVGHEQDGQPYIVRGVTRAGSTSLFVDIGVTRMVAYACSIVFAFLRANAQNLTFDLNPDGTMQQADADPIVRALEKQFDTLLIQQKHASAYVVAIDTTEDMAETRNYTINFQIQERAQGEWISVSLAVVGTLTIQASGQTGA
jgi:hypothetical protein